MPGPQINRSLYQKIMDLVSSVTNGPNIKELTSGQGPVYPVDGGQPYELPYDRQMYPGSPTEPANNNNVPGVSQYDKSRGAQSQYMPNEYSDIIDLIMALMSEQRQPGFKPESRYQGNSPFRSEASFKLDYPPEENLAETRARPGFPGYAPYYEPKKREPWW